MIIDDLNESIKYKHLNTFSKKKRLQYESPKLIKVVTSFYWHFVLHIFIAQWKPHMVWFGLWNYEQKKLFFRLTLYHYEHPHIYKLIKNSVNICVFYIGEQCYIAISTEILIKNMILRNGRTNVDFKKHININSLTRSILGTSYG